MSQYDKAINELLAGKVIRLPDTVNITSFRRQYNRTLSQLSSKGVMLGHKRLSIEVGADAKHYIAKVVLQSTIPFEYVEVPDDPN